MIEVTEVKDIALVSFKERITFDNIAKIRQTSLSDLISQKTDKKTIIINMENVEHLDSGSLGRIVGVYRNISGKKGALVLCKMNKEISNLIHMVALHKIIAIYDTEEEAVKALSD